MTFLWSKTTILAQIAFAIPAMHQMFLIAYDNCYASSLSNLPDLFTIALSHWRQQRGNEMPPIVWQTLSTDGGAVRSASGLNIHPDGGLQAMHDQAIVVIPAMNYPGDRPFKAFLASHAPLLDWLREAHAQGATLCAHCTSSFILAETGLLNGRRATTSWWMTDKLRRDFPEIEVLTDAMLVEEPGIITAGAINAEKYMGLRLIERFMGMDIAKLSAATLLLDNQALDQTVYLREEKGDNHHDPAVVKVKVMLERRLSDDIALESLAADLGMSYRTLIRRFKRATNDTPLHYLQRLRINAAKRLLENSNMPIESLMQEVGYQDLSSFSKLFQRETGLTPSSYRRQARARS